MTPKQGFGTSPAACENHGFVTGHAPCECIKGCGSDQSPPNPSRDTLDHDPVSQFRIWGRCHAVTVGVKSEPQSLWPTKYKLPQYTGTCRETTLQFPCALPEEGMRWIEHGDRCSSGFPCFFRSRGKHVLSRLKKVLTSFQRCTVLFGKMYCLV